VICGANSWTVTNKIRNSLDVGKENLKKMYGPTEFSYWIIKLNQEIYNKFKSPNILTVIEVCGLEWLGGVARLDGEGTVRKLLEVKQGGKKWKT
jgi:hypothetical protein